MKKDLENPIADSQKLSEEDLNKVAGGIQGHGSQDSDKA